MGAARDAWMKAVAKAEQLEGTKIDSEVAFSLQDIEETIGDILNNLEKLEAKTKELQGPSKKVKKAFDEDIKSIGRTSEGGKVLIKGWEKAMDVLRKSQQEVQKECEAIAKATDIFD